MIALAASPYPHTRQEQPAAVSRVGRLVRFEIGGDLFALPLEEVAEIVGLGVASATAPRGWVGTLVRDERPVPIGDLGFLLGLPATAARRHEMRALILRGATGTITFGVTVDAVPAVIDASGIGLQQLPTIARRMASRLVAGSVVIDDTLILVLDRAAIRERLLAGLTRDDADRITELRALPRPLAEVRRADAITPAGQPAPLPGEMRALVLTPIEAADGGDSFAPALPMEWVQEVRSFSAARRIPLAPPTLAGLLMRQGRALPVLDLTRGLTGIPGDERAPRRRLLIVGQPGEAPLGALLVSGVRGLRTLTVDPAPDAALPALSDPGALRAWAHEDGAPIAILEPAALFS